MDRLRSECLSCIGKKQMTNFPKEASEEERLEYTRRVLRILADAGMEESGPVLVWKISALQAEMFAMENPYTELKKRFNSLMLEYESYVKSRIENAEDPLKAAIQYSMVGNYIDFGAVSDVSEEKMISLLDEAMNIKTDEKTYSRLKKDLYNGRNLVFLTDNCGEVVMDKILIETLKKLYENLDIKVLVRGEPVLNDATMEDAVQVGLTEIADVSGNGNGIAGTCIDMLSDDALEKVNSADVIIAKGQGNFETLRKCGMNVYYIFLCKCSMFAEAFGVEKFTGMLINDKDC